jgi:DNA-directed RNA polymerase specialized sigma24 family protein
LRVEEEDVAGLVHRYRAGDSSVLPDLYEKLRGIMRYSVSRACPLLPKWVDAEDAIQQSYFLVASLALSWDEARGKFIGYVVFRLPRKMIYWAMSLHGSAKQPNRVISMPHDLITEEIDQVQVEDNLTDFIVVSDALSRVPHPEVVFLHGIQRYSFTELAARLNRSRTSVYDEWNRAARWLRKELQDAI